MTTIFDLLKEQKDKVEKLNKLRLEVVEEKRMRELDEANLYFQIDFKDIGATTDKLRNAAVKQRLNEFPNIYAQKKAEFENINEEIKFLKSVIEVMKEFGVDTIDLEKIKENQDKKSSS